MRPYKVAGGRRSKLHGWWTANLAHAIACRASTAVDDAHRGARSGTTTTSPVPCANDRQRLAQTRATNPFVLVDIGMCRCRWFQVQVQAQVPLRTVVLLQGAMYHRTSRGRSLMLQHPRRKAAFDIHSQRYHHRRPQLTRPMPRRRPGNRR